MLLVKQGIMKKKVEPKLTYKPKRLIPAHEIDATKTGFYVAVPEEGYKGHPFKIKFLQEYVVHKNDCPKLIFNPTPYVAATGCHCDPSFKLLEVEIKDWLKAEMFRRFPDKWGRGTYTLGYFKVCETL
jgi:hypothetical protein